jgi:hypothetical protein
VKNLCVIIAFFIACSCAEKARDNAMPFRNNWVSNRYLRCIQDSLPCECATGKQPYAINLDTLDKIVYEHSGGVEPLGYLLEIDQNISYIKDGAAMEIAPLSEDAILLKNDTFLSNDEWERYASYALTDSIYSSVFISRYWKSIQNLLNLGVGQMPEVSCNMYNGVTYMRIKYDNLYESFIIARVSHNTFSLSRLVGPQSKTYPRQAPQTTLIGFLEPSATSIHY